MTAASRLGRLFRREGSVTSIRNVRRLDEQRERRLGHSSAELNARFAVRVDAVEQRVRALEAEVLGQESTG